MANLNDTILTAAVTLSGGMVIFGATQVFQRFWLEPIQEHAKAICATAFALYYYGECYANPGHLDNARLEEAKTALRKVAANLAATASCVRLYPLCRLLHLAPSRDALNSAIGLLQGVANAMFTGDGRENSTSADQTYVLLGIRKYGK